MRRAGRLKLCFCTMSRSPSGRKAHASHGRGHCRSEATAKGDQEGGAPAGLPLDGGESGGKFRWRSIDHNWITEDLGFSRNRGGSASQLQFQRRFHELGDSRSEPCKIADVPGQQSICSRFQSAMSNERIIGGCPDDGPRRS